MQFMQLDMFLAVCDEKSFSRATESLSRTNAAVTLAIVKLEKEVGTRLIARSRREVHHPTKAGELVYEYASQILGLRDELRFAFDGAQTGRTERFRIGISTSVKWISPLVESFRRKYPQVRMEICYGLPTCSVRRYKTLKSILQLCRKKFRLPIWARL